MNKKFSKHFGPVLRQIRNSKNMTQETLSALVGVAPPFISMLESGKNYPSFEMFFMIAFAINIKPNMIVKMIEDRIDLK